MRPLEYVGLMDSNPANKSFKVPAIAGEAPQPLSHQHRQQDQPILLTEWGEDHETTSIK